MTPRRIITSYRASLLSTAIVLSASNFTAAQEPNVNSAGQSETITSDADQGHAATSGEIDCSNPPDSIGQRGIENAQPGNPNAPADIQGTRGQQNPATERAQTAQISEYDDNCLDEHERPGNTEAVRDQDNPGGVQPEADRE